MNRGKTLFPLPGEKSLQLIIDNLFNYAEIYNYFCDILPKNQRRFAKHKCMKRSIEEKLLAWRNRNQLKPLILKGARQVGKTWLMKDLGEKHFENFFYINFEKEPAYKTLFEADLNVNRIIKTIESLNNIKFEDNKSLLIFDEIQEAPKALSSLKYFAEDRPKLHVIAAGSLLGLVMDKGSFPVGKVDLMTIRPLSFEEFLMANNENGLVQLLNDLDFDVISAFRDRYIHWLKIYYIVGGMPEAVLSFVESNSFDEVRRIQNSILAAYIQDFAKHAPPTLIPKIIDLWDSLVSQLAKENKKFVYGLIKTGARAREYEQAIYWLVNYGLIHKIYAVNKIAFPLQAYRDLKSFKLFVLDLGLLANMANMNPNVILKDNSFFQEFKGALSEQFVLQELITADAENISYWTNDAGTAELDFVFEKNGCFYPVEVKASENLLAKSLRVFHEKYPDIKCFRFSLSNFRKETWMTNLPLYALYKIFKIEI